MTRYLESITTKDFHYSEFFRSSTARQNNIDNSTSNKSILKNLKFTAQQLQKVRNLLDKPIIITSGFRCEYLNTLVSGSTGSYHLIGSAVDFVCPEFGEPNDVIKAIQKWKYPLPIVCSETIVLTRSVWLSGLNLHWELKYN